MEWSQFISNMGGTGVKIHSPYICVEFNPNKRSFSINIDMNIARNCRSA